MSKTKSILASSAALLALTFVPASYASVVAPCATTVSAAGSSSSSDPTNAGSVCNLTTFDVTGQTLPAYWEFTWTGATQSDTIVADVSGDHPGATLTLDTSSGATIASSGFTDHVILDYSDSTLSGVALTYGDQYIIGIYPIEADPAVTINFNPAAVTATPEPESLALLGTGLALIPVARRKLRRA